MRSMTFLDNLIEKGLSLKAPKGMYKTEQIMEVIGGYRYYTSKEQDNWCKKHRVPPVHWTLKQWRNPRTESGYPVLGPDYNKNF